MTEPLHIRVQAHPVAIWLLIVIVGCFAALFLLGGINGLGRGRLIEGLTQVLIGLVISAATWRVGRYFLLPQLSATDQHLIVRPFWRQRQAVSLSDVTGIATELQTIRKDWRRRTLPVPLHVEHLILALADGSERRFVLPQYAGRNGPVLDRLHAAVRR